MLIFDNVEVEALLCAKNAGFVSKLVTLWWLHHDYSYMFFEMFNTC